MRIAIPDRANRPVRFFLSRNVGCGADFVLLCIQSIFDSYEKYELKNNKALGRYEFDLGGATAAVDYEECGPGCIAVTHTGVPDRFCGQGIASQLTLAVLEDLKRQGLKVVPLCRFMARYILRHPEWKQMVADK